MSDSGAWTVEFYDFIAGPGRDVDEVVAGFGDLHERAARLGARHGTPVLVTAAGHADARLNLFFRAGAMTGCTPATWRRYAFALVVWLEFLRVRDRAWSEATAADVEAFKYWRLTAAGNARRVAPTSFDTDRAALSSFYAWASGRYGIVNPVPSAVTSRSIRAGRAAGSAGRGRDPLRPACSARRQVKWMLRPAFEQWRDIGLRGYGFSGLRRPGWRGGAWEDRDAAFADGLYGTGLRVAEWASVLDVEVPEPAGARFAQARLAAACVKGGGEGRGYRVPSGVLRSLESYLDPVEGSRAEAITRARRAGRYERLGGARIVTGFSARTRVLTVAGGHLPLDAVGPDERRLLFRETPQGLEPLAVWLSASGLPKRAHSWQDTFGAANARVEAAWVEVDPRGRVQQRCPLWCRPHMLRHSFALKWYSILSVVWNQRIAGFDDSEVKDLREQFGDLWYQLAALMGHRNPMTTRDIYLEPFAALEVDYLMSLLDAEEAAGVDALVRAVAASSGRVLDAVTAPGEGWR